MALLLAVQVEHFHYSLYNLLPRNYHNYLPLPGWHNQMMVEIPDTTNSAHWHRTKDDKVLSVLSNLSLVDNTPALHQ
jgi:hypothetical protein